MSTAKTNINPEFKKEAEDCLKKLGLTSSQSIRIFRLPHVNQNHL
jgi:antitoxin component of RelBE/YafQ-DinJ toxin-antitoxin module